MEYKLSVEQFLGSKMFDSNGKFSHKSGYRFKLFPFVTHPSSMPVLELSSLAGDFLCRIEDKKPKELTAVSLVEKMKENTDIQIGQEDLFYETIRQLFFQADGTVRTLNLQLLEQKVCTEPAENRIAEYLVDVMGDKNLLKKNIEKAKEKTRSDSNVLEELVLSKLEYNDIWSDKQEITYYRITNSLKAAFEADFAYVLESSVRAGEDLVTLLELYFFTYTAQASLQLSRFLDGDRDCNIPLYFCLEWEKTSQSRLCFTEGWQKLQKVIEKLFAHAIVLEILNQTEEDSEQVDYIRISEIIADTDLDTKFGDQIDQMTECYRKAISDCREMAELKKESLPQGSTATAIKYLFDSVRVQFENTGRRGPYNSYAKKFESYCRHKFLKSRGRSGLILNLSEETLIFLTKLCIKNQEQMRLNDVFTSFERRGIFLDNISKEQVASYYEKLNLIEKKSDSGDAKYVKRIL